MCTYIYIVCFITYIQSSRSREHEIVHSASPHATIYFGDGNAVNIFSNGNVYHSYSNIGLYNLTSCGNMQLIRYSTSTVTTFTRVLNFGELGITEMDAIGTDAEGLVSVATQFPKTVTRISSTFQGCKSNPVGLEEWDMSSVDTIINMFSDTTVFNRSISNWNVSAVKTMGGVFRNAIAFNQDLSSWDVDQVTYCNYFAIGSALTTENMPCLVNCNPNITLPVRCYAPAPNPI